MKESTDGDCFRWMVIERVPWFRRRWREGNIVIMGSCHRLESFARNCSRDLQHFKTCSPYLAIELTKIVPFFAWYFLSKVYPTQNSTSTPTHPIAPHPIPIPTDSHRRHLLRPLLPLLCSFTSRVLGLPHNVHGIRVESHAHSTKHWKKNSLTTPKDVSKRFSSSNNKVIIELKIVSTIVSIATTLLTVCVGVFLLSK